MPHVLAILTLAAVLIASACVATTALPQATSRAMLQQRTAIAGGSEALATGAQVEPCAMGDPSCRAGTNEWADGTRCCPTGSMLSLDIQQSNSDATMSSKCIVNGFYPLKKCTKNFKPQLSTTVSPAPKPSGSAAPATSSATSTGKYAACKIGVNDATCAGGDRANGFCCPRGIQLKSRFVASERQGWCAKNPRCSADGFPACKVRVNDKTCFSTPGGEFGNGFCCPKGNRLKTQASGGFCEFDPQCAVDGFRACRVGVDDQTCAGGESSNGFCCPKGVALKTQGKPGTIELEMEGFCRTNPRCAKAAKKNKKAAEAAAKKKAAATAAITSHGAVKERTVPACRVGDSACDLEGDVNGFCCPEGTIMGGASIEDDMINGKSVQKVVLKCIGTKRCADDADEDEDEDEPEKETATIWGPAAPGFDPDTAPVPENQFAPCLRGDSACPSGSTAQHCCPNGAKLQINLGSAALSGRKYNSMGCLRTPGHKCNGDSAQADARAAAAKAVAEAAKAAAEATKAAAKAPNNAKARAAAKAARAAARAAAKASKAATQKAKQKLSAKTPGTSPAGSSNAHAGYAGTSVIFSSPGCTGKVIKTTGFTVGQCIRGEHGGSTKANRCSVGGTWEFTSFSDSECKQVATQVAATGADKACTSGQIGTSTRITCKPNPGLFKKVFIKLGLMKG